MSFILDALKKSEAERQRQAGPALLEMRIAPRPRGLPAWAIAVGLVLLAGIGVLGWLALRTRPAPAQTAANAGVLPPAARGTAGMPSAASAWPAPGALPAAAAGAAPNAGVGNGSAPVTQVAPLESAAQSGDSTDTDQASDNPADNAPAVAADPRNAAASAGWGAGAGANGVNGANGAKLRNYAELNGSVPELRLDLHVYAPNPADRYAFINMHKVREGDVTPEGAQVRQITRDGVVLDYRGSEFLLGRQ